ncbi:MULTISPECIES: hypothetical protein [unclassified Xanthomonas]|uniref:hypothetical protein n=1 Tax=unclassified Xanthomonas TaxID=2643310 RepID=UPI002B23A2CA|nr:MULTISPECIES: hypothetical protein [unclassified Xanthomonas]MEA9635377.1 hypothetical protein [Xanthomonas sp. WHRI 8812E]
MSAAVSYCRFYVSCAHAMRQGDASAAFGVLVTILLCAAVARAYRAEYLFGCVLGMTFVFDAVLPCIVFVVIATLSAVAHFMLWPALL